MTRVLRNRWWRHCRRVMGRILRNTIFNNCHSMKTKLRNGPFIFLTGTGFANFPFFHMALKKTWSACFFVFCSWLKRNWTVSICELLNCFKFSLNHFLKIKSAPPCVFWGFLSSQTSCGFMLTSSEVCLQHLQVFFSSMWTIIITIIIITVLLFRSFWCSITVAWTANINPNGFEAHISVLCALLHFQSHHVKFIYHLKWGKKNNFQPLSNKKQTWHSN